MLIKSTRDSGICVGVWEGLREAKAQTKTDPVLPSTPGTSSSGPDLITVRDLTFFQRFQDNDVITENPNRWVIVDHYDPPHL